MTALSPAAAERPSDVPSFSASVSRDLVHRWALGEVFLTGATRVAEDSFTCAAQLPRSHAYFSDAALRARYFDAMLLLETARQAALLVAHDGYGVPRAHKFVLVTFGIDITDVSAMRIGSAPGELVMEVSIVEKKQRKGQVTGLRYAMELFLSGTRVGTAEIGLVFSSDTGYALLRDRDRVMAGLPAVAVAGGHPPRYTVPRPVSPAEVGRLRPENVVVAPLVVDESGHGAQLVIDPDHPSMFDHPQDHLPGMVIGEASRQLAVLAAARLHALDPATAYLRRCRLDFTRFGELEHPVVARVVAHSEPVRADDSIVLGMAVRMDQQDTAICVGEVELAYPLGG